MRTKLRLIEIRNEIEMLQNPLLRKAYEEVHFESVDNNNAANQKPSIFIVTKKDSIAKQIEYLEAAKGLIPNNEMVNMLPSLKVKSIETYHRLEYLLKCHIFIIFRTFSKSVHRMIMFTFQLIVT